MANDLVLRFRGDEGNRNAFFGSIARGPKEVADSITAANAQLLRARSGISAPPPRNGYFLDVRAVRTELDAVNNVVKQFGQLGYIKRRLTSDGSPIDNFFPISDVKEIQGNVTELIGSLNNYNRALDRVATTRKRIGSALTAIDTRTEDRTRLLATSRLQDARDTLTALRAARDANIDEQLRQRVIASSSSGIVQSQAQERATKLEQEQLKLEKQITLAVKERDAARKAENRILQNDVELNTLKARTERLGAAGVRADVNLAQAEAARLAALTGPVSTVPKNYSIIPPQLKQILERGGLQPQPGQSAEDYLQRQTFNAPRYDLVRDVTRYSGSFENGKGIVADWAAEVDKSGKVVTRFGGQLSGASQVLKQISRDFQKVIEWTVATTLVFGTLQYSIEQLNNIKELDFALAKFAITAQQSPQQAQQSFGRLAEIAHNTATPLLEIVGAADDIALATQKAGQSTEEWQRQIFSLTESVGVFTNLTGTDTVSATDLLTATMKQLKLTATDIPAILSKITAVAGGQSQAISDITKGLSSMAEAGRVAGLSLDQQIATVQVLSQVTSKTPAEVATAFKNLVGSLGSPAALKGLAEFNIAVRDQEGNLRNILDVYGEISNKIKSGLIPAADVQGLIRAISGGPRRAPDAAALLAAIDQITTAQQKSATATNEAAIANAKAIDTTKAKLIQLQTTIDAVTFEKFGGEFKNLIESLTGLLTTLFKAVGQIPTGLISAAIQIGLFFVAIRAGSKLLTFLITYLRETAQGFLQVGASAAASSGLVDRFGNSITRAGGGGISATKGAIRSNAVGLGVNAALGAGLSAATGGSPQQIIGGGLQGLGVGLLAIPEPTLLTKVAGGIALLGGTLLQFFDDTGKAKTDDAEKAIQVLDAFSKFKSSSLDLNNLSTSQKQLGNEVERLQGLSNKTAEDYQALDSAQRDYAKGLLDTIDATKQAADSRKDLIDILQKGNKDEQAAAQELVLADRYGATKEKIDALILSYQKLILQRANPDITFADNESLPAFNFNTRPLPATGSTSATNRIGRGSVNFDLTDLQDQPDKVKNLFNANRTAINAQFEVTAQNLELISSALDDLTAKGDPAAEGLHKVFEQFRSQYDIITQVADNLAKYQAYLDGLTLIDPSKAAELQRVKDLVVSLVNTLPQVDTSRTRLSPDERDEQGAPLRQRALTFLQSSIKSGTVDYVELKKLAEDYYNTLDAKSKAATTPLAFITELFSRMGFDLKQLGIDGPDALQAVSDAALDAGESLGSSLDSLTSGISDRLSKLRADLQSGAIKPGQYASASADLNNYLKLVTSIGPKFKNSITDIAGFNETLSLLQPSFTGIVGLEDAASLSSDQFVERLLTLADTYGVNGKHLDILAEKLSNFYDIVQQLNSLKVNLPIAITLDTTAIQKAIANLRAQISHSTGGPASVGSSQVTGAFEALFALEKLAKSLQTTTTSINNQYKTGSGLNYGTFPSGSGGSTAKTGLDVSELDIPEEILQSPQMQELIRQAIANATKLQSQIPGATKDAKNDLVVLLDGLTKVMQVHGVKSEYLSKALDALAEVERKRLEFDTKADTIRRIRVGAGDFSAIANVPVNSTSGVSLGGAEGPINITLNLNGTVLTPAQLAQFADLVAGALKRQIAGG